MDFDRIKKNLVRVKEFLVGVKDFLVRVKDLLEAKKGLFFPPGNDVKIGVVENRRIISMTIFRYVMMEALSFL